MSVHKFSVEDNLKRKIFVLLKKDKITYFALIKKMDEILYSTDVDHYKNLRSPFQRFKRVHINGPFVLIFTYDTTEDKVVFYDLDHHDKIYQ